MIIQMFYCRVLFVWHRKARMCREMKIITSPLKTLIVRKVHILRFIKYQGRYVIAMQKYRVTCKMFCS